MTSTDKVHQKRKNTSEKQQEGTKRKNKKSFKTIGLYIRLGKRWGKSIKPKHDQVKNLDLFEQIMDVHELYSDQMISIEREATKIQNHVPKMSREMRRILLDLDKCHLMDDLNPTIREQNELDEYIGSGTQAQNSKPIKEHSFEAKELKRPKWNNFVGNRVIPTQRFFSGFSTEIQSRREHIEKEETAQREAVKKKIMNELKLPKVSQTTEDLILRRTNLDHKIQIMRICHANGVPFNEQFITKRPRTFAFTSTLPLQRTNTSKTLAARRRAKSCQPIMYNQLLVNTK